MRKLLQLALSPKPKCQILTARLLMPGLSPALLPTLSCLKPHLSAAIGASKQKLSTEPVHPTARVQIMVSPTYLCLKNLKSKLQKRLDS